MSNSYNKVVKIKRHMHSYMGRNCTPYMRRSKVMTISHGKLVDCKEFIDLSIDPKNITAINAFDCNISEMKESAKGLSIPKENIRHISAWDYLREIPENHTMYMYLDYCGTLRGGKIRDSVTGQIMISRPAWDIIPAIEKIVDKGIIGITYSRRNNTMKSFEKEGILANDILLNKFVALSHRVARNYGKNIEMVYNENYRNPGHSNMGILLLQVFKKNDPVENAYKKSLRDADALIKWSGNCKTIKKYNTDVWKDKL